MEWCPVQSSFIASSIYTQLLKGTEYGVLSRYLSSGVLLMIYPVDAIISKSPSHIPTRRLSLTQYYKLIRFQKREIYNIAAHAGCSKLESELDENGQWCPGDNLTPGMVCWSWYGSRSTCHRDGCTEYTEYIRSNSNPCFYQRLLLVLMGQL